MPDRGIILRFPDGARLDAPRPPSAEPLPFPTPARAERHTRLRCRRPWRRSRSSLRGA
jgi:hypothetical protein